MGKHLAGCLVLVATVTSLVGCDGCRSQPAPTAATDAAVTSAAVLAVVNPQNLPVYSGPTGSIEGNIYVEGDASPPASDLDFSKCPAAERMYGKVFREGAATDGAQRPLADALVVVTGYSGYLPEKADAKRVVFEGCSLPARTITMTFGQRLEIANKTKLLFAPSFQGESRGAWMVAPPEEHGAPVALEPPKPGHFTLVDNVRTLPFLKADVYVLLHPLHAVSNEAGHYRIDGVPIGRVDVSTRLAALQQNATEKAEVIAGAVTRKDLTLKYVATQAPSITGDAGAGVAADGGQKPVFLK